MIHHYQVNDFIDPKPNEPLGIVIEKKISLLYDFEILRGTKPTWRDDPRESSVRRWLKQYSTERQLDIALRDLLVGNIKLNTILKQQGGDVM